MKFETTRLFIRRFKPEDFQDLYEYLSDPIVVKYEPYDPLTFDECKKAAMSRYEEKDDGCFWAVCLKSNQKMIGHVYFAKDEPDHFETWSIGYVFNPVYYGHGYATEACKRIIQYGFKECKAHRIVAGVNVLNQPSWRLLERLSMRREGHMLQNVYFKMTDDKKPIWNDSYHYALLAHEWNND